MTEPLLVRRKVAAEMLGICLDTLDAWRARGVGPASRQAVAGGIVLYKRAAIERWVERSPSERVRRVR